MGHYSSATRPRVVRWEVTPFPPLVMLGLIATAVLLAAVGLRLWLDAEPLAAGWRAEAAGFDARAWVRFVAGSTLVAEASRWAGAAVFAAAQACALHALRGVSLTGSRVYRWDRRLAIVVSILSVLSAVASIAVLLAGR